MIYGDFMHDHPEAFQADALEILADFAGMAFDLALQDRQVAQARVAAH